MRTKPPKVKLPAFLTQWEPSKSHLLPPAHHLPVQRLQRRGGRDLRGQLQLGGDGRRGVVPTLSCDAKVRNGKPQNDVCLLNVFMHCNQATTTRSASVAFVAGQT